MQADLNLAKIAASHYQVLNTQNANGNMPERILNAYLNENFADCKENSGGGGGLNKNPSFISMHFGTSQGMRSQSKLHLTFISPSNDRIPSTTPGSEPPRDARDSGSARSHSTHLETSSSDRPKMVTYTEPQTVPSYMSVSCTRRTLRMPSFTRAAHAQPSLSNFPRRDSNFGGRTHSHGMTLGERNFPTSPQNKITKLTHCSIYVPMRAISTPQIK